MYLNKVEVIKIVEKAILERTVLEVKYQHVGDKRIVMHKIAPFDIGSTNPKKEIRERNAQNLYAYSFTHKDDETGKSDPKVTVFNITSFIAMIPTKMIFDETDLALRNLRRTKYDYQNCKFALLPQRDWFGSKLRTVGGS